MSTPSDYLPLESTKFPHVFNYNGSIDDEDTEISQLFYRIITEPPISPATAMQDDTLVLKLSTQLTHVSDREPCRVSINGAPLTRAERMKIVKGVSVCEGNYSSVNEDLEFKGKIKMRYSHVAHIGLSWGFIQFTQDSGSLGKVLNKMHAKAPQKFQEVFGENYKELLAETSRPGPSAQSDFDHRADARKHGRIAPNGELRGTRVKPISPIKGAPPIDIWTGVWKERFIVAGKIETFQEVQMEMAVSDYLNPVLRFCSEINVRSGLGLAMVLERAIRHGPGAVAKKIRFSAKQHRVTLPLTPQTEKTLLQKIATERSIEGDRAKKLLADPFGVLGETNYDPDTYISSYDK